MKRAAVYARVSTDGQRDNYSIPTQVASCLEFAKQKGYAVIGDRYVDSITGFDAPAGNGAVPAYVDGGLQLDMDAADNDGVEYSAPVQSASENEFVVGESEFSFRVKLSIADVSDTDDCAFGFRKKEAYQANIDDYDEMAVLNVISGDIYIETILNGAGTTSTDTTDNFADGETHTLEVRVDLDGAVTYLIDDVAPTTTAAFSFDDGEEIIPFAFVLNAAASAPTVVVSKWLAISAIERRTV